MGHVLVIQRPPALAPYDSLLGEAWRTELGVETVLVKSGPISGELRTPRVERVAGDGTETEVIEHGIRWRFDAARIMFAAGNRVERVRAGSLVRPGESVVDLFAGIGYFAIPAAVRGGAREVVAVDKNPDAIRYLEENARLNGAADRVRPVLGENRTVPLPLGAFDRVFLGYLPSAVPWMPRGLELVRPEGGWLHVHAVVDARGAVAGAESLVTEAVARGGGTLTAPVRGREVKPYGPGRTHVVVDVAVRRSAR